MTLTQINKAGLDELALDHVFTIGASGSSAYTFQGEGLNGTVNNPTLYLTRGKTYRFENGSGGHPIRIQSTAGSSGTAYNTGVTNNAGSGTVIVEVQHDAPDVLYYQCTSHAAMNGILYITGALADGGVTTAKIANDAVTTAKIAGDAVTSTELAANAVTTVKINNDAVSNSKLAANSVSTVKIADDAVTDAKIAAGAVGTGAIATGAVTTSKIAVANVSTDRLADDAVTFAKIQHVDHSTIVGRAAGSTAGTTKAMTAAEVRTIINVADGANQTTINNNADNRIITGSGTANTLNGESGLTYNGQFLVVDGSSNDNPLQLDTSNGNGAHMRFLQNGSTKHYLGCGGGISMGNANQLSMRSTDHIHFATGNSSSIKASFLNGGGLAFNGDTASANALDDYEEGTWTATVNYGNHIATNAAYYTKIGNMVYWMLHFQATFAPNDTAVFNIYGLPFTSKNVTENYGWDAQIVYTQSANNTVIANMRPLVEKGNTYIYFHTVGLGTGTRVLNNLIRSALVGNDTLMGGFYMAA